MRPGYQARDQKGLSDIQYRYILTVIYRKWDHYARIYFFIQRIAENKYFEITLSNRIYKHEKRLVQITLTTLVYWRY